MLRGPIHALSPMTLPSEVYVSSFCRFIDSFGFEWQAHEVAVPKQAQQEKKVLYFFSRGEARVLNDFPHNWAERSWTELEDLCAAGRSVRRDGPVDMHPEFHSRPSAV